MARSISISFSLLIGTGLPGKPICSPSMPNLAIGSKYLSDLLLPSLANPVKYVSL